MIDDRSAISGQLAALLVAIGEAEADAHSHDIAPGDREFHAALAQAADERAERCRRAARSIIVATFPGISWRMMASLFMASS
jgi:hypothetical protein